MKECTPNPHCKNTPNRRIIKLRLGALLYRRRKSFSQFTAKNISEVDVCAFNANIYTLNAEIAI